MQMRPHNPQFEIFLVRESNAIHVPRSGVSWRVRAIFQSTKIIVLHSFKGSEFGVSYLNEIII